MKLNSMYAQLKLYELDSPFLLCRFADVLKALGRSVTFLGKRSDIALDLSNQKWYSSDKEVKSQGFGALNLIKRSPDP